MHVKFQKLQSKGERSTIIILTSNFRWQIEKMLLSKHHVLFLRTCKCCLHRSKMSTGMGKWRRLNQGDDLSRVGHKHCHICLQEEGRGGSDLHRTTTIWGDHRGKWQSHKPKNASSQQQLRGDKDQILSKRDNDPFPFLIQV